MLNLFRQFSFKQHSWTKYLQTFSGCRTFSLTSRIYELPNDLKSDFHLSKNCFIYFHESSLKLMNSFYFTLKDTGRYKMDFARQKGYLLKICRCSARLTREVIPLGRDIFILFRNICNDIAFNRALTIKKVIVSATFWKRDFEIHCNFSAVPRKS